MADIKLDTAPPKAMAKGVLKQNTVINNINYTVTFFYYFQF